MAKPPPTLYSISKTFMWFAIASLILTGSLVAIVLLDHSREWKAWQKKFIELKLAATKEELKDADAKVDKQKLQALKKEYEDTEKTFKTHRKDYGALQKKIQDLDTKIIRTKGRHQDLKQYQDSYRYFYEEYERLKSPRAASYKQKIEALEPRLGKLKLEVEGLEKEKEGRDVEAAKYQEKERGLKKEIDGMLDEKNRIHRRIEKLRPTLAKEILNAPMVDFVAPSLRVQQIVLEDLYDDYHFSKVQKVDRCITCHLGIDQKGFENASQPFKTHPKLDLFLASNSPHAMEKFGCTVCHGGNGQSVSFHDSAHTPRSVQQQKEWEKKYHWREAEGWDQKMLPMPHVEAACAKCHTNVVEVPQASELNRGRKLAETYGCFACHNIQTF